MKSFYKTLDIIDLFRLPVTLGFNKSNKLSTKSGKFLSLFIFSFFMYFLSTSDLFSHLKPQILTQDFKLKKRTGFFLNNQNFTFSLAVADNNNLLIHDPTIFYFEMVKFSQFNGNDKIIETKALTLCKKNDYYLFPEQETNINLNNTYCLPSEGFKIEGYWNENNITYLYVNLNKCQNSSENNNSCKSDEEINQFIDDKYINMYIRSPNVDNGNFEQPFMPELQIYYQQLSSKLYKYIEFYLQKTTVSNDVGWFFQSLVKIQDTVIGKVYYDSAFYTYTNIFYSVSLYSGERETIISRKYQKIQDILAQFAGVCNCLMLIGFFCVKIENGFHLKYLSMNKLYNFPNMDLDKSQNSKKTNNSENNEKNSKKNRQQILFGVETSKMNIVNSSESKCEFELNSSLKPIKRGKSIKQRIFDIMSFQRWELIKKLKEKFPDDNLRKYKNLKLKKHHLKFSFWEYLKLAFKGKKIGLSERDKLFIEGEMKIEREMDIINIVKRFQDVENLKKILLNEKQLYLFEFLSKPMICLRTEKARASRKELLIESSQKINPQNKNENDNYKMYLLIYKELKNNENKSIVDQKLLNLLDDDILQVLDA